MRVLVLGGTGAMGAPVVDYLSESADVYVTSRKEHLESERVKYIVGNAHSTEFLEKDVFCRTYDAIIDFMSYSTDEFKEKVDLLLEGSKHYVFLSSARVYADKKGLINEDDARILDVCHDQEYLQSDEYALAKARCENELILRKDKKWTIVRPYITYNTQRLQLGVFEKENWLRRYLNGHTIILPCDIMSKQTTLTYGVDVAYRIVKLACCTESMGEIYNLSNPSSNLWSEILQLYDDCLYEIAGKRMKIKYTDNSRTLQLVWNKYQIKYDRLYDRCFNNAKQESICGGKYSDFKSSVKECLSKCIENPVFNERKISGAYEGWSDKLSGEYSSIFGIPGKKNKIRYLKRRLIAVH